MPPLPPPGGGTSTYCHAKSYQATWFWPGRSGSTSAWSRPGPGRDWRASIVRRLSPKFGPRSVCAAAARGRRVASAQAVRVIAGRYVGAPLRASNRKDTSGERFARGPSGTVRRRGPSGRPDGVADSTHSERVPAGARRRLLERETERDLRGSREPGRVVALHRAAEHPVCADGEGRRVERLAGAVGQEEPRRARRSLEDPADDEGGGLEGDVRRLAADPDEVAAVGAARERAPQHLQRPRVGDRLAPVEEAPLGVDGEAALRAQQLERFGIRHAAIIAPAPAGAATASRSGAGSAPRKRRDAGSARGRPGRRGARGRSPSAPRGRGARYRPASRASRRSARRCR